MAPDSTLADGTTMIHSLILVEFDLYDRAGAAERMLRLSNVTFTNAGGLRVQYLPRLIPPILLGSRISHDYSQGSRVQANGGTIEFALDQQVWSYLGYVWRGRTFRVYAGQEGDTYDDLELVYRGRVTNIDVNYISMRVSVATTDVRLDLDKPFIDDLYDQDAPESLRERPKPRVDGRATFLEPVLYDEPTQLYHVSTAAGAPVLGFILNVLVGGVPWDEVDISPGPGQWMADLAAGTLQLGGSPMGGDVRCDAWEQDWENVNSAVLIARIADDQVDAAGMAALALSAPELVGNYTGTDPVNRQDLLDVVAQGMPGWWGITPLGFVTAAVDAPPEASSIVTLTEREINSFRQTLLIPPDWRIKTEFARNWNPGSQFFTSVTETDQKRWKSGGIVAQSHANEAIKETDPDAADRPLIRSLVLTAAHAVAVQDRAVAVSGVARRVYDVEAHVDIELYGTVAVNYFDVVGNFRVLSWLRSLGGGPDQLQLWG